MVRRLRFLTIAAILAPALATMVAAILVTATPAAAQVTGGLTPAALAPDALPSAASPSAALPATPALKRDVTVSSELVRIGDLIENAGTSARVPIFRAPDLGQTGSVSAA